MPSGLVRGTTVRSEDEVIAALTETGIALAVVVEDDISKIGFSVEEFLLTNNIEAASKLGGHDLAVGRGREEPDCMTALAEG